MNEITLLLTGLGIALGILIGVLISSLRGKEDISPPTPGLVQEGVIWKTRDGKLVFQIRGALFSLRELVNLLSNPPRKSPPPPSRKPSEAPPPSPGPAADDPEPPRGNEDSLPESRSIIKQVNEILQKRIERSDIADQGVRILEGPNQEMIIWVGLESYRSIAEVPERRIQEVIRDAVRTWEAKNISGE